MPCLSASEPIFRFAPSPNGRLHLGHAYSALLNQALSSKAGGRLLLRLEDIDQARCTEEFARHIVEDLRWLGMEFPQPVRRQSEHYELYADALDNLRRRGLVYPSFLTRGEVKAIVSSSEEGGNTWPRDPDGAPLYPNLDRKRSDRERQQLLSEGRRHAWRLDMTRALQAVACPLAWHEEGDGPRGRLAADPAVWGDVVLSRSDAPSSYHLSVVVDDALQGVTHVVRGMDLFAATAVHRLLQTLLDLPEPSYHHHKLILDASGRKLSKSAQDTGLEELRAQGLSAMDVRRLVGL